MLLMYVILWALFGAEWVITSSGSPIAHGNHIAELLETIHFPTAISISHYAEHTTNTRPISIGNKLADETAKAAAMHGISASFQA